jgi:hypothetical protein
VQIYLLLWEDEEELNSSTFGLVGVVRQVLEVLLGYNGVGITYEVINNLPSLGWVSSVVGA